MAPITEVRVYIRLSRILPPKYFNFEDTFYEQVKGTPMGLLISGFITSSNGMTAEHHLAGHQTKAVPALCGRHSVIIGRSKLQLISITINGVFTDVKFTMEIDRDDSLWTNAGTGNTRVPRKYAHGPTSTILKQPSKLPQELYQDTAKSIAPQHHRGQKETRRKTSVLNVHMKQLHMTLQQMKHRRKAVPRDDCRTDQNTNLHVVHQKYLRIVNKTTQILQN